MKNIATALLLLLLFALLLLFFINAHYPEWRSTTRPPIITRPISTPTPPITPPPTVPLYARIDAHALDTPESAARSVDTLAAYLAGPARNDYEKARAVYRWITDNIAYDVQGLFSGNYGDLSAEGVLRSRKSICQGYATLFQELANAVGLPVEFIGGVSKGYGYVAGSDPGVIDHAWNAVQLDGQWYLLDSTWGAGYIGDDGRFVSRFNDYYFLTRPEYFIYDHLPEDSQWQLLDQPVSRQTYDEFVYLKSGFFQYGLTLKSHTSNTIRANGRVQVSISVPPDVLMMAGLEQAKTTLPASATFAQPAAGSYSISVIPPQAGTYRLKLFAKHQGDPGEYEWVAEYRIDASRGEQGSFPETYTMFMESQSYLYEPLTGPLSGNPNFKLRVPGADDVAVIIDGDFHALQRSGDTFEANVPIDGNNVGVYARFPGDQNYQKRVQLKV